MNFGETLRGVLINVLTVPKDQQATSPKDIPARCLTSNG